MMKYATLRVDLSAWALLALVFTSRSLVLAGAKSSLPPCCPCCKSPPPLPPPCPCCPAILGLSGEESGSGESSALERKESLNGQYHRCSKKNEKRLHVQWKGVGGNSSHVWSVSWSKWHEPSVTPLISSPWYPLTSDYSFRLLQFTLSHIFSNTTDNMCFMDKFTESEWPSFRKSIFFQTTCYLVPGTSVLTPRVLVGVYLIPATDTGLRRPPIACWPPPTRLPLPSLPPSMLDPDTKLVLSEQKFEGAGEALVVGARQKILPR